MGSVGAGPGFSTGRDLAETGVSNDREIMTNRRTVDREERIARRRARLRAAAVALARMATGILVLSSAPAIVFFGHRFLTRSSLFAIEEIVISGVSRIPEREVIAHLGIARGDNLFLVDTDAATRRLEALPWIEKAEVRLRFPQAVEVEVLERRPRALVDLGYLYLTDAGGTIFKRAMPSDPLDLPVITGLPRDEWNHAEEAARQRLVSVLEALEIIEKHPMIARFPVQQIHVDEVGDLTVVLGERGMTVKLGQGDLSRKMERLARVVDEAERQGKRIELARLDNRIRPEWIAARLSRRPGDASGKPEG